MKGERQEEEVSRKRVTVKRFNGLKFVRPSPSQFVGRLIRDRWFHQKKRGAALLCRDRWTHVDGFDINGPVWQCVLITFFFFFPRRGHCENKEEKRKNIKKKRKKKVSARSKEARGMRCTRSAQLVAVCYVVAGGVGARWCGSVCTIFYFT